MARFDILSTEGSRQVRATLQDETIRIERGSLAFARGQVNIRANLPGLGTLVRAAITEETAIRPFCTGTGEVFLEASMGGFATLDLAGEEWFLSPGSYWASDNDITLGAHKVSSWTSFWAGDGFFHYMTRVKGTGSVVVRADGPAEIIEMTDDRLGAEGHQVIGWTGDIRFRFKRPTGSLFSYLLAGERFLRVFEGTGRLLVCSAPYWRLRFSDPADISP